MIPIGSKVRLKGYAGVIIRRGGGVAEIPILMFRFHKECPGYGYGKSSTDDTKAATALGLTVDDDTCFYYGANERDLELIESEPMTDKIPITLDTAPGTRVSHNGVEAIFLGARSGKGIEGLIRIPGATDKWRCASKHQEDLANALGFDPNEYAYEAWECSSLEFVAAPVPKITKDTPVGTIVRYSGNEAILIGKCGDVPLIRYLSGKDAYCCTSDRDIATCRAAGYDPIDRAYMAPQWKTLEFVSAPTPEWEASRGDRLKEQVVSQIAKALRNGLQPFLETPMDYDAKVKIEAQATTLLHELCTSFPGVKHPKMALKDCKPGDRIWIPLDRDAASAKPGNTMRKATVVSPTASATTISALLHFDNDDDGMVGGWRLDRGGEPKVDIERAKLIGLDAHSTSFLWVRHDGEVEVISSLPTPIPEIVEPKAVETQEKAVKAEEKPKEMVSLSDYKALLQRLDELESKVKDKDKQPTEPSSKVEIGQKAIEELRAAAHKIEEGLAPKRKVDKDTPPGSRFTVGRYNELEWVADPEPKKVSKDTLPGTKVRVSGIEYTFVCAHKASCGFCLVTGGSASWNLNADYEAETAKLGLRWDDHKYAAFSYSELEWVADPDPKTAAKSEEPKEEPTPELSKQETKNGGSLLGIVVGAVAGSIISAATHHSKPTEPTEVVRLVSPTQTDSVEVATTIEQAMVAQ